MNRAERAAAVRRLMEHTPVVVPPGLYAEAMRRGGRALRWGRRARRVLGLLLCAAVVAFVVWAARTQPWVEPPSTTPPVNGW
ncbi:hypothetical protein [Streptomyces sp. LaPpAH-108]|uniref:hypothetical protein n=1 Tax=Streptomyces sp. LaPpAH-108 TaxID=1155714 RepID=UPI0003A19B12|nr:hypothetical protein [Streptomyces sp. LaPpAH-108]